MTNREEADLDDGDLDFGRLRGLVFTHRLTAPEVEFDVLNVDADLLAVSVCDEEDPPGNRLAAGGEFTSEMPAFGDPGLRDRGIDLDAVADVAWVLPLGTLSGFQPGTVVSVGFDDDGWRLDPAAEPPAAPEDLRSAMSAFAGHGDHPEDVVLMTMHLVEGNTSWFASAQRPIGEMVLESGLEIRGDQVAPAGFDWDEFRLSAQRAHVQRTYDLDEDRAGAVSDLIFLFGLVADTVREVQTALGDSDDLADDGDAGDVTFEAQGLLEVGDHLDDEEDLQEHDNVDALTRGVYARLSDPDVAHAFLNEVLRSDEAALALSVFAETSQGNTPRQARAALTWLRARAWEYLGATLEAERELDRANSLDPSWPLALRDLARYASDRGDADRALTLLRRAGVEDEHFLVAILEAHLPPTREDLRRNDPCWCGSGRRYKACHRGRERLPLESRSGWLYAKAAAQLRRRDWTYLLIDLAEIRAEYSDGIESVVMALEDPVVVDAALCEGGGFEDFLQTRGMLLPEDELLTAQQWQLIERSVFDVEEVRSGRGVTVRDIRTGDRFDVTERMASRQLKVTDLICTRVVPVGEQHQFIGGVEPVPLWLRDAVVALLDEEPEPEDVVAILTRRFAPPTVTNTEGEDLLFCTARLAADDPVELSAALDAAYEANDEGWVEHTPGPQRMVRAFLRRDGDEVVVETNSAERMDRVLADVGAAVPSLRVVEQTRKTPDEAGGAMGGRPMAPPDLSDPDLLAALEGFVRQREELWLDESIPALGGLTPRQAADDPTRRGELIRLLASFAADEGQPGLMSPSRLRTALGLE